jgi:intracellular sulfur oxidation DsrE/DsrF family protein
MGGLPVVTTGYSMTQKINTLLGSLFLAAVLVGCASAPLSSPNVKAVYHVNTDINSVPAILNNIRNHLSADPKAKIVVVTHGPGINFLLQDAKDSQGREFSGSVGELSGKGVEFRVCNNTLTTRLIDPGRLLLETTIGPSGVSEVARLQAQEGFAYLKP